MAERLSISRAWDETRARVAADGKLLTIVALALIALPAAIAGLITPPPGLSGLEPPSWMPLLTLLVALIGIVGQIAIIRLVLGPISVGEAIGRGFRRLLAAFLAFLLFGIAMAIILIPLILLMVSPDELQSAAHGTPTPGAGGAVLVAVLVVVVIAARFQLTMAVATAEEGGPIRILRRSWDLSKGHYWRLLGFLLIVLVTAFVVLLISQLLAGILAKTLFGDISPFSVAALVVALVTGVAQAAFSTVVSVMLARIYVQLSGRAAAAATVPSSGT